MDAAIRQQVGTADSNAKEMKRKTARESRAAAKAEMRAQIVEAKTGIGASNESSDQKQAVRNSQQQIVPYDSNQYMMNNYLNDNQNNSAINETGTGVQEVG